MSDLTFYFNPNCSKCRQTQEILDAKRAEFETIEYLSNPPSAASLRGVLTKLDVPVADAVRKDSRFKELGLNESDYQDLESVVGILTQHPELLQRPIVVKGDRAVIARPPENVNELL